MEALITQKGKSRENHVCKKSQEMFGGKAWPGEKVKGGVSARGVLFLWVCVAHRVPALASAVTV